MTPAVHLQDLAFSWPKSDKPLFEGVNFVIERGETVCFIGPNGSGKTTLLELILGWRQASAGAVRVAGEALETLSVRNRGRLMALVPQEERLPFAYSALEYVLLGRAPHLPPLTRPSRKDGDFALSVLNRVGVAHLADKAITRLSGGEKRMVLIARALVQESRILLLDEPGNHLDPANRETVMAVLSEMRASGITIIMSSHEPDMVTRLADRVVLLHIGGKVDMGRSEDMLETGRLTELYGIQARTVTVDGIRLILWGEEN